MFYKNLSKRKGNENASKQSEGSEGDKKLAKCGNTKFTPIE